MTISLTDSTGAIDPTGATVTITNTDLNVTLLSTTWQGEPIIANISTNTNYTVSVSAVSGKQPASQSYKAGWKTARSITFDYAVVNPNLYVDLGLPSGTKWAKRNIDITQSDGFAVSEYQYGCSFFSFGNTDGHNPISDNAFSYDFGTGNNTEPYKSSDGATLTDGIPVNDTFDAARANLGGPWRMPTRDEILELCNNTIFIDANGNEITTGVKTTIYNGVNGVRLKSNVNGNILFIPCCGNGVNNNGTTLSNYSLAAVIRSSSLNKNNNNPYCFNCHNNGFNPESSFFYRFQAIPIRAVF